METAPVTIVETVAFLRSAGGVMTAQEGSDLIDVVAVDPACGVSLGGGLYKLRFGTAGRGKSGSVRVVYLYTNAGMPVFLLTVFAKNQPGEPHHGSEGGASGIRQEDRRHL